MVQKLTFEDMLTGNRGFTSEEIGEIMEYERSLIPKNFLAPVQNSVYVAMMEVPVFVRLIYNQAYTGGAQATPSKGTEIVVITEYRADEIPVLISHRPLLKKELEASLVPKSNLHNKGYKDYTLDVKTIEFIDAFVEA